MIAFAAAGKGESTGSRRFVVRCEEFVVRCEEASLRVIRVFRCNIAGETVLAKQRSYCRIC